MDNSKTSAWSLTTMQRAAGEQSLASAALRYANLGIPVFPCVAGGKQPLTPNGFHDATASATMVSHWWQRDPDANIGLPTGKRSGVVVVDVDLHDGASGFPAFERSQATGLTEGWAWLVRTPSGGIHAYYPAARAGEQRSWQVPSAHVDFRGDGGYIIAPPSVLQIDGAPAHYDVIAVSHGHPEVVDAAGLRRFLEPPRRLQQPPASLPAVGTRPDRLADWVATRPEGGRNAGLFWAACRMVEGGHQYDDTLTVLGVAGRTAGLPDREVESTIRSAYRIASRLSPVPTRQGPAAPARPTRPAEVIGR